MNPAVIEPLADHLLDLIERSQCLVSAIEIGFDLKLDATGGAHLLSEIGRGIGGLDLATIDDDDSIADHFDLVKDVGGDQNGMAFSQALDQAANMADLVGVEAIGGFIEDE